MGANEGRWAPVAVFAAGGAGRADRSGVRVPAVEDIHQDKSAISSFPFRPRSDMIAVRRMAPMTKNLQAVYEKGVLRPLEPLDLREQQLVNVTVSDEAPPEPWLDAECLAACAGEADDAVSLEAVRAALAKIAGSLTEDFIAEREER